MSPVRYILVEAEQRDQGGRSNEGSFMGRLGVAITHVEQSTKQRTCRRFELASPVLFGWSDRSEHYEVGYCTNLGLGGIFVLATKSPPIGTQVDLEVVIRAFDPVPGELRLKCTGHVVRMQAWDQLSGFAVAGRFEDEIARKSYPSGIDSYSSLFADH